MSDTRWGRSDFIRLSAQAGGVLSLGQAADVLAARQGKLEATQPSGAPCESPHSFNGIYEGMRLSQIAFPMGGMGAGMICLEGTVCAFEILIAQSAGSDQRAQSFCGRFD
jgi:hypothetical protein